MARNGERRKDVRVQWHTPGKIQLPGVPAVTLPCTVHDLSSGGARIVTPSVETLPSEFTLLLSARRARECHVVWRKKSELGVVFTAASLSAAKPRDMAVAR
jgi:PilZ domain-containing protein